jgi:hydrogenase nickel incorporation protein HypA/HybF
LHELSIAMSLAALVEEQLTAEPCATVTAVDIRVGRSSSIVPEALQFAWDPVAQGTRLQGSELRIHWQENSAALELIAIELSDA